MHAVCELAKLVWTYVSTGIVLESVHTGGLQDASWHRVDELWEGLSLMARLVGNVAGCGNTVDKYR